MIKNASEISSLKKIKEFNISQIKVDHFEKSNIDNIITIN